MSAWTFNEVAPHDPDWGACEIWEGETPVATMVFGVERARLIAAAPELLEALVALTSNPHQDLGDLVYAVREREGEGWDGSSVKAWSNAVAAAKTAIAKAKGEAS